MKRSLITVFLLTLLISCSNDDAVAPEVDESNFYALTVGNSWVYKNYKYNPITEFYEDTEVIDSVSIVNTEIIDGNTYFKFRRLTTGNEEHITYCNPNGEHFELLREFEGDLMWSNGSIKFSNNDYSVRTIRESDWGTIVEQLTEDPTTLNVEAGSFDCINSERFAILSNGELAPAVDKFYYADGYGLIYDTSSFLSSDIPSIIRRLDFYNIQ